MDIQWNIQWIYNNTYIRHTNGHISVAYLVKYRIITCLFTYAILLQFPYIQFPYIHTIPLHTYNSRTVSLHAKFLTYFHYSINNPMDYSSSSYTIPKSLYALCWVLFTKVFDFRFSLGCISNLYGSIIISSFAFGVGSYILLYGFCE